MLNPSLTSNPLSFGTWLEKNIEWKEETKQESHLMNAFYHWQRNQITLEYYNQKYFEMSAT